MSGKTARGPFDQRLIELGTPEDPDTPEDAFAAAYIFMSALFTVMVAVTAALWLSWG